MDSKIQAGDLHGARAYIDFPNLPVISSEHNMLPSFAIDCPYCGEPIEIVVDDSAGEQRYIEDCQVCCRPITISVTLDDDGAPRVDTATQDDA